MKRELLSTFMTKRIGSFDLNDLYLFLQDVEKTPANNSGSKVTDLSLHDFCLLLLEAEKHPLTTGRVVTDDEFAYGDYSFNISQRVRTRIWNIFRRRRHASFESWDDYDPLNNDEVCFWVGDDHYLYLDLSLLSKWELLHDRNVGKTVIDTIEKMAKERGYEMLP